MATHMRFIAAFLALMVLVAALPVSAQDGPVGALERWFQRLTEMAQANQAGEPTTHDHSDMPAQPETGSSDVVENPFDGLQMTRTDDGAFLLGDPDAPVTIIEFADFGCPHCQAYKATIDQFIDEYVRTGQANFEFRTFPTAGGQTTVLAGAIAECADDERPGAFWLAHEYFYKLGSAGRYDDQLGERFAEEYDFNYETLLSCALEAQQVFTDVEYGRAMGIAGTPGVLVRFNGGEAQPIEFDGQVYDRGGVPFEILARVVTEGMGEEL